MAYNSIPANANAVYGVNYDSPQYQAHEFGGGTVGLPHIAAAGSTTGNGAYSFFVAPVNCLIYSTVFAVDVAGTGATSNVVVTRVAANNGANVSNTVTFQNTIFTGVNAAGNVYSLQYNYNVFANGVNSSSNVVVAGGFYCNAGDQLVGTHTGNTLCLSTVTEWRPADNAVFTL